MSLFKRGHQYWIDVTVNRQRYREPLGTSDVREARKREKDRIAELGRRPIDPTKRRQAFRSLTIDQAIAEYCVDRRAQVSPRAIPELWSRANELGFTEPDHFLFSWQGRAHQVDPTRPIEA